MYRAAGEPGRSGSPARPSWEEYRDPSVAAWATRPLELVLAECAEAEAIRKAVPKLGGIYLIAEPAEMLEAAAREAATATDRRPPGPAAFVARPLCTVLFRAPRDGRVRCLHR